MPKTKIPVKQIRDLSVSESTGLTIGITAGNFKINGNYHEFAGQSNFALTASSINYVELNDAGSVVANTSAFTSANIPLAEVVTNVSSVTSIVDKRPILSNGGVFIPAPVSSTDNYLVRFNGTFGQVQDADIYVSDLGWMGLGSVAAGGSPGQLLHLGDGNMLIEGGGETAFMWKRDIIMTGGASGTSTNPIFQVGRIIQAGDGDPEIRFIYSDDAAVERVIMELDRKGIIASVKQAIGSHFEGFVAGDVQPFFRLNSYPDMRLEMGPGGTTAPDVAVARGATDMLNFMTGPGTPVTRMSVTDTGGIVAAGKNIIWNDNSGSKFAGFKAPTAMTTSTVWDLPVNDGANGEVLSTNGSGVLSWTSAGGGAGIGSGIITSVTYTNGLVSQYISDGTTVDITYDSSYNRVSSKTDGVTTETYNYNPDGTLATITT